MIQAAPELAIIIVSYDSLAELPACLDSLPAATRRRAEIAVIDNASTDGTVGALSPRYPNVRWIANEENLGFGRANNTAFAETSAPLVLFLNPDTVVPPGAIDSLCGALERLPKAGCVGPRLLNPDGSFQRAAGGRFLSLRAAFLELFPLWRLTPRWNWGYGYLLPETVTQTTEADWVAGTCLLSRREVICEVGGFDPRYFLYFEDMDLSQRVRDAGYSVCYVPEVAIVHARGRSMAQVSPEGRRLARESARRYVRDHHSWAWLQVFRAIMVSGCLVRIIAQCLLSLVGKGEPGSIRRLVQMASIYM